MIFDYFSILHELHLKANKMFKRQGEPPTVEPSIGLTVQDAAKGKMQLQQDIAQLIRRYEQDYGLPVTEIDYTRVTAGGNLLRHAVEVTIKL